MVRYHSAPSIPVSMTRCAILPAVPCCAASIDLYSTRLSLQAQMLPSGHLLHPLQAGRMVLSFDAQSLLALKTSEYIRGMLVLAGPSWTGVHDNHSRRALNHADSMRQIVNCVSMDRRPEILESEAARRRHESHSFLSSDDNGHEVPIGSYIWSRR